MIVIIDYGAGNLRSVQNAISRLGYPVKITRSAADIAAAGAVILPGVGAAADTVAALKSLELVGPVRQYVAEDRPFLGICIGLQVLFSGTEEGGWHECLDIVKGKVTRLPEGQKIPHMGWNQVRQLVKHPVFTGVPDNANFYFVHSYYVNPTDRALVAGETEYGVTFPSIIIKGNLIATQFHPEKSGDTGLKIYDNFFKLIVAKHSQKQAMAGK
jgi:glutamine amidotransferase